MKLPFMSFSLHVQVVAFPVFAYESDTVDCGHGHGAATTRVEVVHLFVARPIGGVDLNLTLGVISCHDESKCFLAHHLCRIPGPDSVGTVGRGEP